MKNNQPCSLCATMALAAVLALGSTPVLAQSAQPAPEALVIDLQPAANTPAIVLPAAPVMQSSPVIQQTPAIAAAAEPSQQPQVARPAPQRAAPTAKPLAGRTASPVPVSAAPVSAAPVSATPVSAAALSTITPVTPAPSATSAPGNQRVQSTPTAQSTVAVRSPETEWEIGLAALVGIGLIGGGAILIANARRRREVLATEQAAYRDATLAQAAIAPNSRTREPVPFTMPNGPIPACDARDAAVNEMVEASPDDENPFHTRKARRRRARTVLAQHDAELRNQATQPFDWRTYEPISEPTVHPDRMPFNVNA